MKTCDCINETIEQLKPRVIEPDMKPPKGANLLSVGCCGTVLTLRSGFKLNIPFRANWALPNGKTKETRISVLASFCPFCGKSTEETK